MASPVQLHTAGVPLAPGTVGYGVAIEAFSRALTPEEALDLARSLKNAAFQAVDLARASWPDDNNCPYCGLPGGH